MSAAIMKSNDIGLGSHFLFLIYMTLMKYLGDVTPVRPYIAFIFYPVLFNGHQLRSLGLLYFLVVPERKVHSKVARVMSMLSKLAYIYIHMISRASHRN